MQLDLNLLTALGALLKEGSVAGRPPGCPMTPTPYAIAVRGQAPGVRLRFVAESSTAIPELRCGEVDLAANANRPGAPDIRAEQVGETRLVAVVRRGHPLARARTVTVQQYAAAEHLTVSRRGNLGNALDDVLARLGLARRVVAAVPTEAAAPEFARGTDLLVTVPEITARAPAAGPGPAVLPLPLELPRRRCTFRGTSATTPTTPTPGSVRRREPHWPPAGASQPVTVRPRAAAASPAAAPSAASVRVRVQEGLTLRAGYWKLPLADAGEFTSVIFFGD